MKTRNMLLLIAMMWGTVAFGQAEPDMIIPSAKIRGIVLNYDGETPVEDMRVRVWDADTEKIVYKTVTDDGGLYWIPEYKTGSYYVTIGPVKIDTSVLRARGPAPQNTGFILVLPKRMPIVQTLPPTAVGAIIPAAAKVVSP